ncbi:MAG: molybdenum cofactor guanylyltransferase, partial [Sphingobacteriales bacterium]
MKNNSPSVNGYILAGGKSLRMGEDKGLILFNGKPMIAHVIEQVKPTVQKAIIVSNNKTYEQFGLEVISDLVTDIGPAGGILSSLTHTHSDYNFICSCDMPFIKTEAINFLIEYSFDFEITVAVHHDKIQPLFAVYSKNCLAEWRNQIQKNNFKLQELITQFN